MRPRLTYLPLSIASIVLAAGTARVGAQSIYLPRTTDSYTAPRLQYIKLDTEFDQVSYRSKAGGATSTERIYLAPTFGLGWNYFLYHPDLLTFSVLMEPGYNWQQYRYAGAASEQNSLLLNGTVTATLLQLKPYAVTFNYGRSHDEYQYDFFNSATVDSANYGATTGYRQGAIPFTVSVQHATRDSSWLSLDSTTEQTTVSLHASNLRSKNDSTDLNYQFSTYASSSTYAGLTFDDNSETHYLGLTDVEHFKHATLGSSLTWNHQVNQAAPSDDVIASLDLGVEHGAHLRSFYDYSVASYTTDGVDSLNQRLRAGLTHQLYESLTSSVDAHGALADSDSFGSTLAQQSYGTSGSLEYSKRLGSWGHLSLGDSLNYDRTHQDSAGVQLFINDESHPVPLTGIFFLNTPRVTSVISAKDSTGTITLIRGASGDYDVNTSTDPWQIQVFSSGPNHIAVGQSVQVTYIVQPNPSGNYSVLNNQFQVRLNFWHESADIYARYNSSDNQTDSSAFVLENISEFQAGADVHWQGLRADASYTDRKSSLYDYQSFTLAEGYSLRTSAHSTAGIDLRQQWSAYPGGAGTNAAQNVTYYSFTGRFEWHPGGGFSVNTEAGYEQQRGAGVDQDLIVVRSYLNWLVGKLDFRLGYEYQNQQYTLETRDRQFVFLRMRRNF